MTGGGQGFSPKRELVLMARAMTRWLRANGFPGERVSLEVRHPSNAPRGSDMRTLRRAYFMRGRRVLGYGVLSDSDEEATGRFYKGVAERFGASTAAELEVRFAVLGQDAVGRLLDPSESPRQGLV